MNTERESLQSQQAKAVPDIFDVLRKLIDQIEELTNLSSATRGMVVGSMAHIDDLEKRIARLESGGF